MCGVSNRFGVSLWVDSTSPVVFSQAYPTVPPRTAIRAAKMIVARVTDCTRDTQRSLGRVLLQSEHTACLMLHFLHIDRPDYFVIRHFYLLLGPPVRPQSLTELTAHAEEVEHVHSAVCVDVGCLHCGYRQ